MDCIDTNRIEEFRPFKNEIRGPEQHLIVGIDIADLISQGKCQSNTAVGRI